MRIQLGVLTHTFQYNNLIFLTSKPLKQLLLRNNPICLFAMSAPSSASSPLFGSGVSTCGTADGRFTLLSDSSEGGEDVDVGLDCGYGGKGFGLPVKLTGAEVVLNGGQQVTFLKPDGYFSFNNVPAGTHLIEVAAIGYFFSPVRVDVSARNPGKVQAALTENRRGLNELVLEPLKEEQYYEIREPFSVMSLAKSPMGLMVGFMIIVMFVMPKMVENMDPEEIKRAQDEMRTQEFPPFLTSSQEMQGPIRQSY